MKNFPVLESISMFLPFLQVKLESTFPNSKGEELLEQEKFIVFELCWLELKIVNFPLGSILEWEKKFKEFEKWTN